MATTSVRMQQRRDTTANWVSNNPILGEGELGYDETTDQIKIGDGTSHWADLAYINITLTDISTRITALDADPTSAFRVQQDARLLASTTTLVNTLVPAADTSNQGKVELATTAETVTGTDSVRAVTPAGLTAGVQNLADTRGGIVVLASKYGAVGDGATDNLTALTNALTAIKAASVFAKAATLKLDAGTFLVSTQVPLDAAGLRIIGDGSEATILKLTTTVAGTHGVIDVTSTACRIEGVTLDANAKANFALYGTSAHRLRTLDVRLKGSVSHGVYLTLSDDVTLSRVSAISCGTTATSAGFFTSSCSHLQLDTCTSTGSYEHGYYLLGGTTIGLTMTACTAYGNGGYGITARYSSQTIIGCVAWGNTTGAFTSTYPVEPSTKGSRQTVTGNVFGGSTGTVSNEVVFLGQDLVVFTGNYVETANATSAVVLFSSCNDSTATGNTIVTTSTSTTGGLRYTSCTGYVGSDNAIIGAGTAGGNGVYIATSSTGKIAGNRITNWNTGVTLSASTSNDVHVTLNHIVTVTTRVSNSSTGTNCVNTGNSLSSGYFDPGVPVRLPVYATASRPGASVAGNGGFAIDSDLNRLIWSNGSAWKVGAERVVVTATLDFPSIAAGATAELTTAVSGTNVGDAVALGPPATIEAGLMWAGYVSAGGSVKVRVLNTTGGAIDPASATWTITVVR